MTTPQQPPNQPSNLPSTSGPSRSRVLPIALAVGLVAAVGAGALLLRNRSADTNIAVAGSDPVQSTEPGAPGTKPSGADNGAAGAEPLSVEITSGGGFTGWGADFRSSGTRLENGVLYTEGAMTEIWPQQALHPIAKRTLSSGELEALRSKLAEAGLLTSKGDFGQPNITDMPITSIKVTDKKGTYTNEIYAASFLIDFGSDGDPTLTGLTEQQIANRKKVNEFLKLLSGPDREDAYAGDSAVFIARRITTDEIAGQDPAPTKVAWPLPALLTAETENGVGCTLVTGADGKTLLDTLQGAKENSIFTVPDGGTWSVAARVVLPGEKPCPAA